jgi:hypothetical protein
LQPTRADVQTLRARATQLQRIAEQKPDSKEARDAAVEEVQVLVKLAQTKDAALASRRHQLVEKLKKDETLPLATRARLAGLSANIEVATDRSLDPDQKMAAYADVGWQLVRDFPDRFEGYASLLRIARDSNDAQAAKIAEALIDSKASNDIKQAALQIQDRIKLIGQPLVNVVGKDLDVPAGSPVCVYTWTARHADSLTLAKEIQDTMPAGTKLIGICLDGDTPQARSLATQGSTPGQLIFPTNGKDSPLCQRLVLDGPKIYITASDGTISTVSGYNYLAVKQWKKSKEGKR